jgi:hypothetical protein
LYGVIFPVFTPVSFSLFIRQGYRNCPQLVACGGVAQWAFDEMCLGVLAGTTN